MRNVENNGLPIGTSPGMHTVSESDTARTYAMECKRMIQAEANKQVISEMIDIEFVRSCQRELDDAD